MTTRDVRIRLQAVDQASAIFAQTERSARSMFATMDRGQRGGMFGAGALTARGTALASSLAASVASVAAIDRGLASVNNALDRMNREKIGFGTALARDADEMMKTIPVFGELYKLVLRFNPEARAAAMVQAETTEMVRRQEAQLRRAAQAAEMLAGFTQSRLTAEERLAVLTASDDSERNLIRNQQAERRINANADTQIQQAEGIQNPALREDAIRQIEARRSAELRAAYEEFERDAMARQKLDHEQTAAIERVARQRREMLNTLAGETREAQLRALGLHHQAEITEIERHTEERIRIMRDAMQAEQEEARRLRQHGLAEQIGQDAANSEALMRESARQQITALDRMQHESFLPHRRQGATAIEGRLLSRAPGEGTAATTTATAAAETARNTARQASSLERVVDLLGRIERGGFAFEVGDL